MSVFGIDAIAEKGEVGAERVVGEYLGKRGRKAAGSGHGCSFPAEQTETDRLVHDVRVERHDERAPVDEACP